jgi:chromosome partitioning protein
MITVIGSLKGGSGKSTVTFNLAVWLSMAGIDVEVIDTDPQATLTDVADLREEEGYEPIVEVRGIGALDQRASDNSVETLIDVGTADIASMKKAIALADRIVVPVPPSQADIWSAQRFIGFVQKSVNGGKAPEMVGFINRGDTHHAVRETDEAAAALVSLPGIRFIKPRLSQRTIYRRSFSEGLAVFELDPRGKGSSEFTRLTAALYPEVIR